MPDKSLEDWITEIENRIDVLKSRSIRTYFNVYVNITDLVANGIADHLRQFNYDVEVKRCARGLWDIIIRF